MIDMGDYDYANARLRVLKGRLLTPRVYLELAALTRVDDLIARLAQSTYGDQVRHALARFVGPRVVMEACRLHLADTYHRIRRFFDEEGARLVGTLLARWDLFNLKTILRGQETSTLPEEILEALVPAGELDESALQQLVRQADPRATVDLLRTWNIRYAVAAQRAWSEFTATREWIEFEATLDRLFYEQLLASLEKGAENDELVREYLMREIDAANLMVALRLRELAPSTPSLGGVGEASHSRHFLGGGTLTWDWLANLANSPRDEEILALLGASRFGPAFVGLDSFDLTQIQRALDRDLVRFGIGFFARDPLTIATAVGLITAKRVEAMNLRVITEGIALGVNRAEIENELVL